jgi:hypothetical protein
MALSVLVVDLDSHHADTLSALARRLRGEVMCVCNFDQARQEILRRCPLLLVSAAKVGFAQGAHLAQAAIRANSRAHAIMFGSLEELVLARDVFSSRTVFTRRSLVTHALPHLLRGELPLHDRRDVRIVDRRTTFRGGRRATDLEGLWGQH